MRTLHDNGAAFATTLAHLEDVQKQITKSISDQRIAVAKVQPFVLHATDNLHYYKISFLFFHP